jgi:thiol-disulfide isomerase/thioredoxin
MFIQIRLAVFAFLLSAAAANAGEVRPFDAAAFEAAQAAQKPIVIHATATWCPTCQAQIPIVQSLADDPENGDLLVFTVDFDNQTDVLRRFNVRHQSTLIAFRGTEERARTVGDTNPDRIAALVASAQ